MKNTSIEKREQQIQHTDQQRLLATQQPQRAEQVAYFTPLVDIAETNDVFLFQADLPGAKPGDVDIQFNNRVLTIEAKVQPRQPQATPFLWREYGVGHFHRSFTIDTPIDVDGIRAELKNGVLSLFVPKAEHARTRKIQIQAS